MSGVLLEEIAAAVVHVAPVETGGTYFVRSVGSFESVTFNGTGDVTITMQDDGGIDASECITSICSNDVNGVGGSRVAFEFENVSDTEKRVRIYAGGVAANRNFAIVIHRMLLQ